MMIKIIDNFLLKSDHQFIYDYCLKSSYCYGETDDPMFPSTGMVNNLSKDNFVYDFLNKKILSAFEFLTEKTLYRMYINCFAPGENPYFHIDGSSDFTLLYYPNLKWEIQDGGETQFYVNNELRGIFPIPNRLVLFDANIVHRATSFRDKHRFTVAIKYN